MSTPVKDVLNKVLDVLYFDDDMKGKNATFLMPKPGNPANSYAVVKDPKNPTRCKFIPASDVALEAAKQGVDVMDFSINDDSSQYYCELEPDLYDELDEHVTKLNDVLQNEPNSDAGVRIVKSVAAHLASTSIDTMSLVQDT